MYEGSIMRKPWREWFTDLLISSKSLRLPARSNNPEVNKGEVVIWLSDGTWDGDDGDIMVTIKDTIGTEKTTTLVDFSTL